MKIVFLDFDGVLNGRDWICREDYFRNPCDPEKVKLFDEIINRTDAYIVISSSWRSGNCVATLSRMMKQAGFKNVKRIIDITPRCHRDETGGSTHRGYDIDRWLRNTDEKIESFVILDDDSDMAMHMSRLVNSKNEIGLEREHVEAAVALLNGPSSGSSSDPAKVG